MIIRTLAVSIAALICACSQQGESPDSRLAEAGSESRAGVVSDDPSSAIPWFDGTVEAALTEAKKSNRPVFLFWSATWCPYCQDLKASVFSRPDVMAKMSFFVPVYLDGDAPGAQKTAEEFRVSGYPTVLVLKPDRTELARISGGMDLSRYAEVLDLVLGDVKPVKEMLASLDEDSDVMLSGNDCRRLAYNAWSLDPENRAGAEELRNISAALSLAARRCPTTSTVERARLTVLAAAAATDSEEDALKAGQAASPRTAALLRAVRTLLEDVELSTAIADSLQELSENFFLATRRGAPEASAQLLQRWIDVMTTVANDSRYSEGQRLAAVASELHAAKALSPKGIIPVRLGANARSRVRETLARKHDSYTRAAVVNASIDIHQMLGEPEQAYTIAQAELATATTPYYYMLHLAAIDEKRGQTHSAINWMKRAYEESKGPATRFRWGTSYVTGLIRMRPTDVKGIQDATLAVLGELDGPDALRGGTASRLKRLEKALLKWRTSGAHDEVIKAARARMNEICGTVPSGEEVAETCKDFLAT